MQKYTVKAIDVLRILFILLLLILTFLSINCIESPLEPIAPTYELPLCIPILQKYRTFGEFISDTSKKINTDSTISYIQTFNMGKTPLDPVITHPQPDSEKTELGAFYINGFTAKTRIYGLSYFGIDTGLINYFPDTTIIIDSGYIDLSQGGKFEYAAIDTGTFIINIENNFPFDIDIPSPIILWNTNNENIIAEFVIDGTIPPGTSKSSMAPISKKIVYKELTVHPIRIHTNGSDTTIRLTPDNNIKVTFQSASNQIRVDSAYSVIPRQTIESDSNSVFIVDDSITIKHATFRDGYIKVEIKNTLDVEAHVLLEIKEIKDKISNECLRYDTTFTGRGTAVRAFPIKDYYMECASVEMGTRLNYTSGIKLIASSQMRKVSKKDFVQAKVWVDDTLEIEQITGNFPTQYFDVNYRSKSDFEIKNDVKVDSVKLKGLKMKLRVPISGGNTSPPPIKYQDIVLLAKNTKLSKLDSVMIGDGYANYAQGEPYIDFTKVAGFEDFVNRIIKNFPNLPDSLFVRGKLIVNPDFDPSNSYTISYDSYINTYLDIDVPSHFSIAGGYLREGKRINIDKDYPEAKSIKTANLGLAFENGIPIEMIADVCFYDTTTTGVSLKFSQLGPIEPAEYDTTIDRAIKPRISNITIRLSNEQIKKIIESDSISISLMLNTDNGTKGDFVRVLESDMVKINVSINARYIVNRQ